MLRATTACTFSTSQLPKVVRHWCVLYILTWKCASRHNGVHFFAIATSKSGPRPSVFNTFDLEMCFAPQRVHFFISHLASWVRTRRFKRAYFSTLRSHKSLEKHSESRLSYLFAHLHLLSSDLFSSDSSHLCFSTVHIVGSFTSKLPSTIKSGPRHSDSVHPAPVPSVTNCGSTPNSDVFIGDADAKSCPVLQATRIAVSSTILDPILESHFKSKIHRCLNLLLGRDHRFTNLILSQYSTSVSPRENRSSHFCKGL